MFQFKDRFNWDKGRGGQVMKRAVARDEYALASYEARDERYSSASPVLRCSMWPI